MVSPFIIIGIHKCLPYFDCFAEVQPILCKDSANERKNIKLA